MAKETKSLYDAIQADIQKSSGSGFVNFFGLRESGAKCRVRFLNDFEEGYSCVFHDKWNGYNHPCLAQYGKECPNCGDNDGRTGTVYYWNVYNYETKKVQIFGFRANKASPIAALASIYKELGDITTQDMVIQRNGTGTGTTYIVIPTGKIQEFKKDVKKFKKKEIFKILLETYNRYGDDESEIDEDDYDDDEKEIKRKKKPKSTSKKSSKYDDEDEDDDDDYEDDEEDEDDDDFEDDEDEEEIPAKKKSKKSSKATKSKTKKRKPVEDDDEDEDDDDLPFDPDEDDEDDEDDEEELPPPKKRKKR